MTQDRIAILMPGDMGHGVGRALRQHRHDVMTCLAGRSARTRSLAEAAGIRDTGSLEALVAETDLILSILPPDAAVAQAGAVAAAMTATGARPVYVDCNAVSPMTVREVGATIAAAGAPTMIPGAVHRRALHRSPASQTSLNAIRANETGITSWAIHAGNQPVTIVPAIFSTCTSSMPAAHSSVATAAAVAEEKIRATSRIRPSGRN